MNKKTKILFSIISITILFIVGQIVYLKNYDSLTAKQIKDKSQYLKVTALPDLAISTEAMYIRHRSLSDLFSVLKEGPELREYFPSTFTYSHSHILNNTPSKVLNEK